ncbi:unnamed protein product [Durusdinium trenchii]|uniref:Uncharacterized protein n=2 Tax=Durusdinium trenchii TaxID=1381693 RepID=A0ABP0QQK0_9DINO
MACAKPKCEKPLGSPYLACRCGQSFCSEACFVAVWHSKHSRQCPNAEDIKKEMMEKAGGPQGMLKNGAKLLMAVAVTKLFAADVSADLKEVSKAGGEEEPDIQHGSLDPSLEKSLRSECAELREAHAAAEEMKSRLQVRVEELDREFTDSSERLQLALREVSRLEKQLQSMEGAARDQGNTQQLQAEVAKLRVENTDMWRDVAGLRAENNDLKDDLGELKKSLRQAEEAHRQAVNRADVAEEELKANGQGEQAQRLGHQLEEKELACTELQSELSKAQHDHEETKGFCAAIQHAEQLAREELASATEDKNRVHEESQRFLNEAQVAVSARDELQGELRSTVQELQSIQEEKGRMVQAACALRSERDDLVTQMNSAAERLEQTEAELSRVAREACSSEELCERLDGERCKLMANLEAAEDASQKQEVENEQLHSELYSCKETQQKLDAELKKAVEGRARCEEDVLRLQTDLKQAEEERQTSKQKMEQLLEELRVAERRHERQEEECKKLKEEWAAERSNTQDCQGIHSGRTRSKPITA